MALTFGFYNSINHDRRYDAVQVGQIFDGIINDGVYGTYKQSMIPKASSNANQVIIQPGRAWFNHTWTYIDSDYTVNLPAPDTHLARWDVIVLDIDSSRGIRRNSIQVVSGTGGTPPQLPSLIHTEEHNQYQLAYVYREPGVNVIPAKDIENRVGQEGCPLVTGLLEVISLENLIAQWRAQFEAWLNARGTEFDTWLEGEKTQVTDSVAAFHQWLEGKGSEVTNSVVSFQAWVEEQKTTFQAYITNIENGFYEWIEAKKGEITTYWNRITREFEAWMEEEKRKYAAWLQHNYTAWTNWFTHIQYELDGDVAGHLQQQIDWIRKFTSIYVVDKTLYVPMSAASVIGKKLIFARDEGGPGYGYN